MDNIISIYNLCKYYGSQTILQNINMQIGKGQIVALLGENGAGKSTLLNILCTSILADRGDIFIDGHRLKTRADSKAQRLRQGNATYTNYGICQLRQKTGMVFQQGLLDHQLSIKENLLIRGSFYHIKNKQLEDRISSISQVTGITNLLSQPYGVLSGGQKRRCDIARALLSHPTLLLLDEPTAGLDPQIQIDLWKSLKTIQNQYGTTILLSTHDMNEAALSNFIYVLKKGTIIEHGTPAILKEKYTKKRIELKVQNDSLYDTYLAIINGG